MTYTQINNEWFKFNDTQVQHVNIETVKHAADKFYILGYESHTLLRLSSGEG